MDLQPSLSNKTTIGIAQTVGVLLIAFLAISVGQRAYEFTRLVQNKNPQNTFAVSGEGKLPTVPDLAIISLGVTSQGQDAGATQKDSTEKINAIVEFVKGHGIDKKDITTSQFSMYPQYDYSNGGQRITGYQANQLVTVKVHGVDESADTVTKILGGVTSAGANQINGVTFDFEDPEGVRQEARGQAIAQAKAKAKALAEAAGIKLGKVVRVSETPSYGGPIPYYAAERSAMGMGGADAAAVAPTIEPGTQDIAVTVTLEFEIK